MKYLFIGGVKDGQWIEVPEERPVYQFHVMEESEPRLGEPAIREGEVLPMPRFLIINYYRLWLRGEKGRHLVYLLEGMTADEAISKLFKGYKP